jgi:hypothetical protein
VSAVLYCVWSVVVSGSPRLGDSVWCVQYVYLDVYIDCMGGV